MSKMRCAYMGEDGTSCGNAAVGDDGMCAMHTTHSVVTEHPWQPRPTPNAHPPLWPMVMRGWDNSLKELGEKIVERLLAEGGSHESLLYTTYLANMIQVASLATIMGKPLEQVKLDMQARHDFGTKKYGTSLQPHNGRDALKDAYDELLDGQVYLRQKLFEMGYEED